jgi:hypothetical protein
MNLNLNLNLKSENRSENQNKNWKEENLMLFEGMHKAFRFSENLADLFFLLLRHKFSSIAYVRLVNFNAEKRKKKEQKIRKPRCFEFIT